MDILQSFPIGPLTAALAVLTLGTMIGIWPARKIIMAREARHELRIGSAGYLPSLAGWSVIAFWLMSVWFCGTVIGDWWTSDDLQGAMARAAFRLRLLLEVAASLSD